MQDFPANSQKAKARAEPREKVERVTSAETVRRKRGLGTRFKETFIGGDARSATDHVVFSVVVPEVRDMLYNAFVAGMETMIYGESKAHRRGSGSGYPGMGHVRYDRMGPSAAKPPEPRLLSRRSRARHDFDDVVISSRSEAEEVIDRLFDLLSRHGSASVADLYELTGVQSSHVDMKWGWTELRGARAIGRNGRYMLDLPEPEPLD